MLKLNRVEIIINNKNILDNEIDFIAYWTKEYSQKLSNCDNIFYQLQDNNRTLKIWIKK